jgi:hypothetical protein
MQNRLDERRLSEEQDMKQTNRIIKQKGKKSKYRIEPGEYELCVFGRLGQRVGKLSGDTAYKDVSASSAFLKYPYPAIAHTIAALEYMREMGIVYIDVLDKDSGTHYRTTVQKYFDEGEYFWGGAKWGDQLKLALPNFTQTRSAEYSSTDAQGYSEADSTHDEVKPLRYKSHAPKGVTFTPGKQLTLWGRK